jgi:hypothetical protein
MDRITSLFKKSGPKFESASGAQYDPDPDPDPSDENMNSQGHFEGVGDSEDTFNRDYNSGYGLERNNEYTQEYSQTQIQTEMQMSRPQIPQNQYSTSRTRVWGVQAQAHTQLPEHIREVQDDEEMVYVESAELEAISRDLQDLNMIAKDMSELLDIQEEQLDEIDKNVEQSTKHVKKAGAEVETTLRLMKSSKYKKGAITTTGCAAVGAGIGLIGGPIGAGIGAGIGGAVGLVGSTVSSMF